MQSARRVEEKILKDYKVKPGRIRVVRNMELGAQLVAEGLGVGFIRQGYQKNIHYPKPVKYYTIDVSKYGQDVVVAYRQDVELTDHASDDHADEGCGRGVFETLIN